MVPKRHWLKMGIELEGGWNSQPELIARRCTGASIRHDGSVGGTPALYHGEVVTRPHDDIKGILLDVKKMYPEYINDSCGFHIHTSFTPMDTTILADKAFHNYFLTRWEAWARANLPTESPFWRRFKGLPTGPRKTIYASPAYMADKQLRVLNKTLRYTALNFVSWHQYGTIENRLLPMFESQELMEGAVRENIDIFESYLNEFGWKKVELEWDAQVDENGLTEVHESFMPDLRALAYSEETEFAELAVGHNITYTFTSAPEAISLMRPFREVVSTEEAGY